MADWLILQSGPALGLGNDTFANPPSHLFAPLPLDVDDQYVSDQSCLSHVVVRTLSNSSDVKFCNLENGKFVESSSTFTKRVKPHGSRAVVIAKAPYHICYFFLSFKL